VSAVSTGNADGRRGAAENARTARLGARVAELELDALMVCALTDVRYLTGFTGSNGLALVRATGADAEHRFLTDFRYTSQAAEQVADGYSRRTVAGELPDALAGELTSGGAGGRLGFDETKTTVKGHRRLLELLGDSWQLVACNGAVEALREVKDAGEIALIRAACKLADAALTEVLEAGLVGRTEQQVAFDLETRMRRLGAEAPSFPSIVASGAHGALPHAEPRDVEIGRDVLVTIDWGAVHDGYYSDCTRTYATGEGVSELHREIYALVLDAQIAGLAAARPGRSGREVDADARAVIEQAGYGERFGHGLGHGVGLDIHEGPRLARTASEEPLRAGNVVSVEPGVYLPDALGVRIEDLIVVGEDRTVAVDQEVLTGLPKELTVIS
jgi:Xaa-Pro aminopeptidase